MSGRIHSFWQRTTHWSLYQTIMDIRITYATVSVLPCIFLNPNKPPPVWSNFEIADMDFWRGEAYTAFFDFLDKSGGFYYEVRLTIPWCGLKPYDVSAVTKNWKTIGSAGATRRCTPSHWHCSYPDRSCISSSKSGTSMPRS